MYEVQENPTPQGDVRPQGSVVTVNASPIFSQATSPYQVSRCPMSSNPVLHPPAPHMQQRTIQKTVLFANRGVGAGMATLALAIIDFAHLPGCFPYHY